ncbi:MAG: SCO family protein [Ferruginibacter sp.]
MYRIVLLIGGSLLFAGCNSKNDNKVSVLPYYNSADFTPLFLTAAEAEKKINHHIADFTFTDQDSQIITQKTVEGKIHVANFFFTGCGSICPKMMSNLKQAENKLGHDSNIVFLSYSVTPWTDSVPKLKKYAENESIKSPWHLLTGTKTAIYNLARTSYFAEEDLGFSKDSSNFLHTEHILLIDKRKRIRGIYNGTLQLETDQLVKDIASLKAEE